MSERSNRIRDYLLLLICLCAFRPASASEKVLWQIGKSDNDTAEFALGRADSGQYSSTFPTDALYIVGHSDPKQAFPYIQPGPADAWAGHRRHTFTIVFGVESVPAAGDCELLIDFVDTHSSKPPKLEIGINDTAFVRTPPKGGGDASGAGQVNKGIEHVMSIRFPCHVLKPGNNTITITSLEGSWVLYDYLKLTAPASVKPATLDTVTQAVTIDTKPYLIKQQGKLYQPVLATVLHIGESTDAWLTVDGNTSKAHSLVAGTQVIEGLAPAVEQATQVSVTLHVEGKRLARETVTLQPVRKWEIYLLHHTHLDIGYTHVQTEVEQMQWQYLEDAIELGEKTKDYPEGARFKWLPEGLWAVDSYLKQASSEQEEQLIDAVRKGYIGLDALYGNELTALPRPEELLELTGYARRLSKKYGLTIDSAMITDVPGYTWGLVPVLAHSGVKYLSIGPNFGHRIGYTLSTWGDKPFYWESPSGKDKLLCWMAGMGYSWFHTGLNYTKIDRKLEATRIFDYLKHLEDQAFPYDMVQVRYNIGSDNGPCDPMLPDIVRAWNETYAYPKMVIASASEMFSEFEGRYGDRLPTVRGDFTPYWEDGAASSARETTLNRAAAERLVQAQTLYAMLEPDDYPVQAFHDAYREALLYDEHTWGSWNSISEPEGDFTKGQWQIKQAFAVEADKMSRTLLDKATQSMRVKDGRIAAVEVFNTCSWRRSDVVVIPKDWNLAGVSVRRNGSQIQSQHLSTGELAFVAACVPAFGSACFTFHDEETKTFEARIHASDNMISSDALQLVIDKKTGAIASLTYKGYKEDLVDQTTGMGLNDYVYVEGRDPHSPQGINQVRIRVKEAGPLIASLLIESNAPGCEKLSREVRVVRKTVDIIDTLDKTNVYEQEGVHIAFPFNVPSGVMRMDIPFAVVRPELDQLAGSCKNYFTVQRWVDVSNDDFGVTWVTPDAPLVEVGAITNDPRSSIGWIKTLDPTTTLYSYVMNNYWETNYKASQSGEHTFRYSIRPHKKYQAGEAARFAIGKGQPLLAVPCPSHREPRKSILSIQPIDVIATALKPTDEGDGLILRLFNASGQTQRTRITLTDPESRGIHRSNLQEQMLANSAGIVKMVPWEIVTLRISED